MELAFGDIEKDGGCVIDLDPREADIDCEEENAEGAAAPSEAAFNIRWVQNVVRSVLVDGGDGVKIGCFGALGLGGHVGGL